MLRSGLGEPAGPLGQSLLRSFALFPAPPPRTGLARDSVETVEVTASRWRDCCAVSTCD